MLPANHPFADLQAQAALAGGWPVLALPGASREALEEKIAAIEENFGAMPQAVALAPWGEEPWTLQVEVPHWGAEDWLAFHAQFPEATLSLGVPAGTAVALAQGQRVEEGLEGGGIRAVLAFDADHGGVVEPEWARRPLDPEALALEASLVARFREVDPRLVTQDAVGVVDRQTGRFGLQLTVPDAVWEPLEGEALLRLREAAVAVVAAEVEARRTHPRVRLAPDLLWDTRAGLTLTLWLIAPAAQAIPGDLVCNPSIWRDAAGIGRLDGHAECVEIQLIPSEFSDHDRAVEAALPVAAAHDLLGAPPRWMNIEGQWAFCPVWCAHPGGALAAAEALAGLAGVRRVRVLPGEPRGLGEVWTQSTPAWFESVNLVFLRVRDGLECRDRRLKRTPREKDTRDLSVESALYTAASECTRGASVQMAAYGLARAISDSAGRNGLEISLDPLESLNPRALTLTLEALGRAAPDTLNALANLAFRDGVWVQLWYRGSSEEPPIWE